MNTTRLTHPPDSYRYIAALALPLVAERGYENQIAAAHPLCGAERVDQRSAVGVSKRVGMSKQGAFP